MINLRRDFENLKMKEAVTVKQHSDRIMPHAKHSSQNPANPLMKTSSWHHAIPKKSTKLVIDVLLVADIDKNLLSVAYTNSLDETKLWHKRMGYVDYKSLSQMSKNNLIEKLLNMVDHEDVCEVCQLGKQARLPTKAVEGKTPFEAWYDFKPSVSHLRVFGCTYFVYVPEEKRSKMDIRSQLEIFTATEEVCEQWGLKPDLRATGDQSEMMQSMNNRYEKLDTIRLLITLVAQKGWSIHQMDVKSAFLNDFLKEEIYAKKPQGFAVPRCKIKVYKLHKALYGLKQAPRACNSELVIVFKDQMQEKFKMSDLGKMTYFLGLEVNQACDAIFIRKKGFATKILRRYSMENCKPVSTPIVQGEKLTSNEDIDKVDETSYRSLVGYLLYLTASRPDIIFVVKLLGYSNSDWAGSTKDMKSTLGYFFTLGSSVFCWSSKKQETMAQSSTEAEYIAAAAVVNQAIWLRKLLNDLNLKQEAATKIKCDNQSAIAILKNLVFHGRIKHFKIKYHFVREVEQAKEVTLVHCSSQDQLADILTKPLGKMRFEKLCYNIGLHNIEVKEKCCEMTIHVLTNPDCKTTSSPRLRAH
ncbi:Integrase, catalytic core [Gossypium australe]|uniref:Integrase, catalytic core n=1 Tax=Gossypium australe TaxID=47621 RepID=A0A5B6V1Q7_9ROSI|nr:Integrase, catalytic core [Gossypium australe]